jgi:enoyl-CoA hydratase
MTGAPAVLLTEPDGTTAVLTMNRPEALNALSLALERALKDAFRALSAEPDLRAIILTGRGRAFCAGVDLKELARTGTAARDWLGGESLAEIIRACPVPVIAAVNGFAVTGGLELALLADFIIAAPAARFADTHARVGITPSWGLSQMLPRRIGEARARQMSFTGAFVDAGTALDWGLVNELVPADELMPRARAIATEIAGTDPTTLERLRGLYRDGAGSPLDEGLALEARVFAKHIATVTPEAVARNRAAVQARGRSLASAIDGGKDD